MLAACKRSEAIFVRGKVKGRQGRESDKSIELIATSSLSSRVVWGMQRAGILIKLIRTKIIVVAGVVIQVIRVQNLKNAKRKGK